MEGLETLVSLEYLALNANQITVVEGINSLRSLQGLNLANNQIEFIKGPEFPLTIQLLSLKNNPVVLVRTLAYIEFKLPVDLGKESKRTWYARRHRTNYRWEVQTAGNVWYVSRSFPSHLNKYAESIKAIQSRKEKEQKKEGAVLMTQGFINEEEALRELKEKTSKLLVETKS